MNSLFKTCTAVAAASVLLVACGGGNDDDPTPSNEPGVLTVTESTVDGLNGVYGNGALNLTDVERSNPIGSTPELCGFRFDGANKVGSSATAFGDLRYRSNTEALYVAYLTFAGREFASGDAIDTAVVRSLDRVELTRKVLTASGDCSNGAPVPATPTLMVTICGSTSPGMACIAARRRSPSSRALSGCVAGATTANSSPP